MSTCLHAYVSDYFPSMCSWNLNYYSKGTELLVIGLYYQIVVRKDYPFYPISREECLVYYSYTNINYLFQHLQI